MFNSNATTRHPSRAVFGKLVGVKTSLRGSNGFVTRSFERSRNDAGQLIFQEREKISQMVFSRASDAEIAVALKRSRSAIYRERTRNACNKELSTVRAQPIAEERRSERPLKIKMDVPEFNERVRSGITKYWSPE